MATYEDKLLYTIDVDQTELDAISAKVRQKATAAGIATGSAPPGRRRGVVEVLAGAAAQEARAARLEVSATPCSPSYPLSSVSRARLRAWASRVRRERPVPRRQRRPGPRSPAAKSRAANNFINSLFGTSGPTGPNSVFGQAMRSGFGIGGAGGSFLGHMMGNLPPLAAVQAMYGSFRAGTPGAAGAMGGMFGHAALRGAGGAIAGNAGAALAGGGTPGLIALGLIATAQNLTASFGHLSNGTMLTHSSKVPSRPTPARHFTASPRRHRGLPARSAVRSSAKCSMRQSACSTSSLTAWT